MNPQNTAYCSWRGEGRERPNSMSDRRGRRGRSSLSRRADQPGWPTVTRLRRFQVSPRDYPPRANRGKAPARDLVFGQDANACPNESERLSRKLAQARHLVRPPAVQAVRSASIVAVLTRPETARARSVSDVTKASACSCVSATNSASNVVSHP